MPQDLLIGKQLGAYLIQSCIGEGGMARVYKAYHTRLRRDVALKVIASQIANRSDFQLRFEREAQLVASLEHHNIVAIYDFGEVEHITYLVMQYVGGGTLHEQLRARQPIDARRAVHYAQQMAQALHHAHQHGIVHRDVKPQNLLLSASDPDHLLLSDFGIARLFDNSQEMALIVPSHASHDPALTDVSQIIGTAEYMAPEQAQRQTIDARTDVYALGIVLYQMLTGRTPFQATTATGLMYQHVYVLPTPIHQINPSIPEALAAITAKAIEKSPAARFPSAEAMAQALEAFTQPTALSTPYSVADYISNASTGVSSSQATSQEQLATSAPAFTRAAAYNPTLVTTPIAARSTHRYRTQKIAIPIFIILALVLLLWRILPLLPIPHPPPPGPTAFTETFQSPDGLAWTDGNQNNFSATINHGQYVLSVTDSNTHFPYAQGAGMLPADFTLTTQIKQTSGPANALYGLTFYFTTQGTQQISCYAFVISNAGNYAFMTYTPGQAQPITETGSSTAIHANEVNTLTTRARANTFQFSINGRIVPINTSNTVHDLTYHSGQPGLIVTGPNTAFSVRQALLTIP